MECLFLQKCHFRREARDETKRCGSEVKVVIIVRVQNTAPNERKHEHVCCKLTHRNEEKKCLPMVNERTNDEGSEHQVSLSNVLPSHNASRRRTRFFASSKNAMPKKQRPTTVHWSTTKNGKSAMLGGETSLICK